MYLPLSPERVTAVDLGTSRIRAWRPPTGTVLDESAVVALNLRRGTVYGVGTEARAMIGRTPPGVVALAPLDAGAVVDFEAARLLVRHVLDRTRVSRYALRPAVFTALPVSCTGVQIRAVEETFRQAGAGAVHVLETPTAAALGAGMPIERETGSMVVDIGAGSTDMGVFAFGTLVSARSLPVAGNAFDEAVAAWLRREHQVQVGAATAERIKIAAGTGRRGGPGVIEARGLHTGSGQPTPVRLSAQDVHRALAPLLAELVRSMGEMLTQCPTELSTDIMKHGIVLTGGGSHLGSLRALLTSRLGLSILPVEDPQSCTVRGLGMLGAAHRPLRRPAWIG